MSGGVELRPLSAETRPVVRQLWQLYRHDLSEFRDSLPDEHGRFHERTLAPFFEADEERAAYLVYRGRIPVGFAFASHLVSGPILMSEFFVVRSVRRQGVAGAAVDRLFALHPGTWEIPFQERNAGAARFWRRATERAARDGVREELRPVEGKPHIPHDVWLTVTVA
jgi:predicted acetyltransferase